MIKEALTRYVCMALYSIDYCRALDNIGYCGGIVMEQGMDKTGVV